MSKVLDSRLVFLDLETTGLDPQKDLILEAGIVLVSPDLQEVLERTSILVCPKGVDPAIRMNDFVLEMHRANGLLADLKSQVTYDVCEAETYLVQWLSTRGFSPGTANIAGYSIHFDRSFLRQWMPTLDKFFDYRMVDVSSVRALARRWVGPQVDDWWKTQCHTTKHRVIDDCLEALEELRRYRDSFFDAEALRKKVQDDLAQIAE